MRSWFLSVALIPFLSTAGFADVSKQDIRKLVENKISDNVIVAYIKANSPVKPLTSDEIVEIKKWGASDRVVQALIVAASAEKKTPKTVNRTEPRSTYYAGEYPSYSSYSCSPGYGYYGSRSYYSSYYPSYSYYSGYYSPYRSGHYSRSYGYSYYRGGRSYSSGRRFGW